MTSDEAKRYVWSALVARGRVTPPIPTRRIFVCATNDDWENAPEDAVRISRDVWDCMVQPDEFHGLPCEGAVE